MKALRGMIIHRSALGAFPHFFLHAFEGLDHSEPRSSGRGDLTEPIYPTAVPRPEGHPDSHSFANSPAGAPGNGVEQRNPLEGFNDRAIKTIDLLDSIPETDPLRPVLLNSLPDNIKRLVEQGIRPEAQVNPSSSNLVTPASRPDSQSDQSNWSNALTISTSNPIQQSHRQNELVTSKRDELSLYPKDHPHRPNSMIDLAQALISRFEREKRMEDLNVSITLSREALDLCSNSHPSRPTCLSGLSHAIMIRYRGSGQLEDGRYDYS